MSGRIPPWFTPGRFPPPMHPGRPPFQGPEVNPLKATGLEPEWTLHPGQGGILDIGPAGVNRIGASNQLTTPPVLLAGGVPLWTDWSHPPSTMVPTTILDARSRSESNTRSLILAIDSPDVDILEGTCWVDLKARIEWGTGSEQSKAIVDILNGTLVSFPASFVRLIALYTAINNPYGAQGLPPSLRAGGSLGYGTRPATAFGPCFTCYTGAISHLTANNWVDVNIPPYANAVSVYPLATGKSVQLTYYAYADKSTSPVTPYIILGVANQPLATGQVYPLPNARWLRVSNTNTDDVAYVVRFQLAL